MHLSLKLLLQLTCSWERSCTWLATRSEHVCRHRGRSPTARSLEASLKYWYHHIRRAQQKASIPLPLSSLSIACLHGSQQQQQRQHCFCQWPRICHSHLRPSPLPTPSSGYHPSSSSRRLPPLQQQVASAAAMVPFKLPSSSTPPTPADPSSPGPTGSSLTSLPEGFSGREEGRGRDHHGVVEGHNDWKQPGWRGATTGHRYRFRLFALDGLLDLGHKVTKEKLLDSIGGHVLGEAELVGIY
ncbi:hypothetical protein Taro_012467 [Colocasia esculenta]|uniref:Uncharacterized protein n=1 Tax=Colocasia esculenta TaxID=4460 RepID=A0A843UJ96_COLES|nr:hypothetical protein [Colocasia esculenta]